MFPDQAGKKFGIGRVNKTNRNEKAPIHIAVEKGYLVILSFYWSDNFYFSDSMQIMK